MYDMYKDIAEFRIVYIDEAHALDDLRPVRYAVDLGIKEHKNIGERCTTADMMMANEHITIPCIVDNMDNKVNAAYNAHPDRIFVVRKDGRLAVAGDHGPWGFKPALQKTKKWLEEYKKNGKEPGLPDSDNHAKKM